MYGCSRSMKPSVSQGRRRGGGARPNTRLIQTVRPFDLRSGLIHQDDICRCFTASMTPAVIRGSILKLPALDNRIRFRLLASQTQTLRFLIGGGAEVTAVW